VNEAKFMLVLHTGTAGFARFRTPSGWSAIWGSIRACASPAASPPATAGSPRPARLTPGGMLAGAAWSASKAPGPLRAFDQRVWARRGMHIAVVATARKLAVLCWHLNVKGDDYAFALPSLIAHKQRKLELRAGAPSARGHIELPEPVLSRTPCQ